MKKLLLISLVTLLFSCEKSEEPDCGCFEVKKTIDNMYPNSWIKIDRTRLEGDCFDIQVRSEVSFLYLNDKTIRTNIECDSWL